MRIENYSNNEIRLKKTVKTGGFIAAITAGTKGISMIHDQYCAISKPTFALKKIQEKKELAEELSNQFLDKSPKMKELILKPFNNKIELLQKYASEQKYDFKSIINPVFKTAGIAAVVAGVLYLIISTLDDLFDSD